MFCTHCGASNKEKAAECVKCGKPITSTPVAEAIPNYLVQAILTTLCCCLPFGIVAIVYAAQVNNKIQEQDWSGARSCSQNAKTWCWVALGIGFVWKGVLFLVGILAGLMDH